MSSSGRKIAIYPAYLDSRRSRKEGRRVPLSLAVKGPTIEEIYKAAKRLKLNPVMEPEVKYPRTWFFESGRVMVLKIGSKQKTLRLIAEIMRRKSD